jgi:redox-sensitive bicupin YhaK (pirin superfamily)
MVTIRRSTQRGHATHGWLDSYHSFSFDEYHDPNFMGFKSLRVINEDFIAAGQGFGTHRHRDMEILTYVLAGALRHADNLGTGSVLKPGDVQLMTAGLGISHSEFNESKTEPLHLLQIWIIPERLGLNPEYRERKFGDEHKLNQLGLIASSDARENSLRIYQDADVYASILETGRTLSFGLRPGRSLWIQIISGALGLGEYQILAGDAAAVSNETKLSLVAGSTCHFLLFDLI